MKPENVFVVSTTETKADMREDCRLVTQLLRKVVTDEPSLTLAEAFALVKCEMMKICVLDWDSMEAIEVYPRTS